jgi:hypothetical protein
MSVTENDIELLHAYLDGELPTAECEGLWRRLAVERELASELDHLRADQSIRNIVWSSLEPDDATVGRLQASLMRSTRREDILGWANNALRIAASAAALILFGFAVGWMGHGRMDGAGIPVLPGPSSPGTSRTIADTLGSSITPKYEVTFFDASKKPVAVMKFDTREEAERFIHDFQAAQSGAAGSNDTNTAPSGNRF